MAKPKSPSPPAGDVARQVLLAPSPADASSAGKAGTVAVGSSPSPAVQSGPMLEAVVERVLSTLNCDGLSKELSAKLAERLLGRVEVDALVDSLLGDHADELTSLLTRRLTERLLQLG